MRVQVTEFLYDRNHYPLCVMPPTNREAWEHSMTLCTAEHNRVKRQFHKHPHSFHVSSDALLSNGMTMGEFGIYFLCKYNAQRQARVQRKKYKSHPLRALQKHRHTEQKKEWHQ
jgi:hypothetical protein